MIRQTWPRGWWPTVRGRRSRRLGDGNVRENLHEPIHTLVGGRRLVTLARGQRYPGGHEDASATPIRESFFTVSTQAAAPGMVISTGRWQLGCP